MVQLENAAVRNFNPDTLDILFQFSMDIVVGALLVITSTFVRILLIIFGTMSEKLRASERTVCHYSSIAE